MRSFITTWPLLAPHSDGTTTIEAGGNGVLRFDAVDPILIYLARFHHLR
jgi:hypothetical protein